MKSFLRVVSFVHLSLRCRVSVYLYLPTNLGKNSLTYSSLINLGNDILIYTKSY